MAMNQDENDLAVAIAFQGVEGTCNIIYITLRNIRGRGDEWPKKV